MEAADGVLSVHTLLCSISKQELPNQVQCPRVLALSLTWPQEAP